MKAIPTLGDAPIEEKHRDQMVACAQGLDKIFNGDAKGLDRKVGFILLVYPFGANDGRANYISNGADRKDVAIFLREQAARFESQDEASGK